MDNYNVIIGFFESFTKLLMVNNLAIAAIEKNDEQRDRVIALQKQVATEMLSLISVYKDTTIKIIELDFERQFIVINKVIEVVNHQKKNEVNDLSKQALEKVCISLKESRDKIGVIESEVSKLVYISCDKAMKNIQKNCF